MKQESSHKEIALFVNKYSLTIRIKQLLTLLLLETKLQHRNLSPILYLQLVTFGSANFVKCVECVLRNR
jgi:hypothetical protein